MIAIAASNFGFISNVALLTSGTTASDTAHPTYYREFVTCEGKIEAGLETAELDAGEVRPSQQIISGITRLVEIASRTVSFPAKADISVFFGEAVVTWKSGARQVTLLSRGNPDDPKLLQYESKPNSLRGESEIIPSATAESLRRSIKWLYR
jgi:hypothetical protein